MKLPLLLSAAGIAVASITALAPSPASAQISVSVGPPAGPGWYRYHSRGYNPWGGPAYYKVRGPHYGWYRWRDDYYQNCSWRWVGFRRHRHREWTCW